MRRVHALAVAVALLSGCKSDAEKLVDLRTELRSELDGLYAAYGGSGVAAQAKAEGAAKPEEPAGVAARVIGELDRSYFEGYCLARGRGERPFSLSGKLDGFLKDRAHDERCRAAARLEARIAELEAKVGK